MFFIPGWLIALVTFPGVIVHEVAHQLFCRRYRVAVLDVCYFRAENPAGYVVHEIPRAMRQSVMISVGPFLVNTVLGALIGAPAAISVIRFGSGSVLDVFLAWLGISIAMHAFPSTGDAESMRKALHHYEGSRLARMAVLPLVWLIWIGALGSMVWLDAIYGILVATALPNALVALLA